MNPPPGESIARLLQRVKDFADEITIRNPGARLILVSHGITIAGLICLAEGLPSAQIYHLIPQNTEIKHLTWQVPA
jgi:alpha-ribazole phosphatase/probable phosphoglycerate mutase